MSGSVTATGPLTDTQLRAVAVPVSGSVTATVASTTITGSVAVTGPVTDTQIRATPLPVSGTVATTGTYWQATQPVSGTVTTSPPANASTNIAQINAVTPLMGSGATGTGSLRVTLASDSPGMGTANGTIPTQSELTSGRAVAYGSSPTPVAAGNNAPLITDLEGRLYINNYHPRSVACQFAAATTATLLELTGCAAVASNSYYITGWQTCGGIANAATVPALLRSGTGTNCGTATVTWGTCWHTTAGCCGGQFVTPIKVTAAHAICGIDATVGTKSFTLQGYLAP